MNPSFYIGSRRVGYDDDPLVIAEIGINHNGCLETAKRMAKTAIDAGVDIVKHQTHIVEDEMTHEADIDEIGYIGKTIYQLMKECALNEKDELELMKYVHKIGGIFISTPFSRAAADRLNKFNVPAYKIGSGECNNYPLLEHIASFGKPIILSTGMNTLDSIEKAVNIFKKNNVPYAILHTTNIYPTPPHLVRLGAMSEIQEKFPEAVIGLSDHTTSNHACFGAVALGASILERHYTDTMEADGPDIINSMDPSAARELVDGAKIIKQERGGHKGPVDEEKPVIEFAYASVVTISNIKKGELFSKDNLWVKRPGTGPLFAEDYENIIGKISTCDILADQHLKPTDISK
tara:strand:- start:4115 stop:5158 length:1044 start_codon:yes stop_codon:yes gene_type:complete